MNPEEEKNQLSFTLSPDAILNSLLGVIKECNDSIVFGLNIIKDVNEIPTDTLVDSAKKFQESGIQVQIGEAESSIDKQKAVYKNWLLKKGFEDLIKAVNLAVIEAYLLINIQKLVGQTFTVENLNQEIDKLQKDALNQANFPQLLKKIGFKNMTYENPVLTINRVRNCLVHRNGIVMKDKDINDKDNNTLSLEYYAMELVRLDENGKETDRLENTGIGIMAKLKKKQFKIGERVTFDVKEFNGCIHTCQVFGIELVENLKNKFKPK